jgi:hypothetical protein
MPRPMKSKVSSSMVCSVAVLVFVLAISWPARAQPTPSASPSPPQVQQLLQLMQDPVVRAWMDEQQRPTAGPTMAAAPPTMSAMMTQRITGFREHLASLAAAMPHLPGEFRVATYRLLGELQGRSVFAVLALLIGFLALGAGTEWLFRKSTASLWGRTHEQPMVTVPERLRAIALRPAFDFSAIMIFVVGSIGAFLAFDWPPLVRHVVTAYLIAVIMLRLVPVAARFLLAPRLGTPLEVERFRLLPMTTEAARFWYGRLALFAG